MEELRSASPEPLPEARRELNTENIAELSKKLQSLPIPGEVPAGRAVQEEPPQPVRENVPVPEEAEDEEETGRSAVPAVLLVLILAAACVLLLLRIRTQSGPSEVFGEKIKAADMFAVSGEYNTDYDVMEAANTQVQKNSEQTGGEVEIAGATTKKNMVQLTEEQKYKGDLILVNAWNVYHFEENADLKVANIRENQSIRYTVTRPEYEISSAILSALDQMIDNCGRETGNSYTGITSAYRTLEYQQTVWNEIAAAYGEEYTRQIVAVPGYSEHHTGLAVDFGIFYADGSEGNFSETPNADWMKQNCWKYGFIRRFPEDKTDITGISNETWHFRYVGIPHAYYMTLNNLCLEEYIDYLRRNTMPTAPLAVSCEAGNYRIYFTAESEIKKPKYAYTVSGNNVDGYIVTYKVG